MFSERKTATSPSEICTRDHIIIECRGLPDPHSLCREIMTLAVEIDRESRVGIHNAERYC